MIYDNTYEVLKPSGLYVFTIFLLVSVVTFALLAYHPRFESAAYPLIGINFLGATLFFFLGFGNHKNLMKLPELS